MARLLVVVAAHNDPATSWLGYPSAHSGRDVLRLGKALKRQETPKRSFRGLLDE